MTAYSAIPAALTFQELFKTRILKRKVKIKAAEIKWAIMTKYFKTMEFVDCQAMCQTIITVIALDKS